MSTPAEIAWQEEHDRLTVRVAEAKQAEQAWEDAHGRFSAELDAARERSSQWGAALAAHVQKKPAPAETT